MTAHIKFCSECKQRIKKRKSRPTPFWLPLRNQLVKQVAEEREISIIEASTYVKQNNLWKRPDRPIENSINNEDISYIKLD